MKLCIDDLVTLSDGQLVNLTQKGVREAFDELIRRHRRRCLAFAASILRNAGDAEEECQNGYSKAYSHINQFHGNSEFITWLLRIIENQCLMLIRRKSRVRLIHLDDTEHTQEKGAQEIASSELSPEHDFAREQIIAALRFEVSRVPPLLREMLVLRDLEQLPMQELASRMGISLAAAKSRLLRARQELRNRMMRYCGKRGAATLISR